MKRQCAHCALSSLPGQTLQGDFLMVKTLSSLLMGALLFLGSAVSAAELTVSAAASLTNAFTEMQKVFEVAHPGLTLHMNYAASNPLLRQIVEGAPVDVFASADQATMDKANEASVIDQATRKDFVVNDLVLIVPTGAPVPTSLDALLKMKHIAVGNPDSVPAGRYAKTALEKAGLWDKLKSHFIYGASVRQVLDYVARGEVDAGIVYATDAKQMGDKVNVALKLSGHDPILYPIAVVKTGPNPKAAHEFMDFVLSPEGQAILAKYGFAKPGAQAQ